MAITVFIASQYLKGVGPMVRGNCDYIFLQPIYNKTQRDVIWDLEAAFLEKPDFSTLMDEVIVRENLEGNSAADPKKSVRIMVCADFEDSSIPAEKFYHFTPVRIDDLPPFRLCHPKYWKDSEKESLPAEKKGKIQALEIKDAIGALNVLS